MNKTIQKAFYVIMILGVNFSLAQKVGKEEGGELMKKIKLCFFNKIKLENDPFNNLETEGDYNKINVEWYTDSLFAFVHQIDDVKNCEWNIKNLYQDDYRLGIFVSIIPNRVYFVSGFENNDLSDFFEFLDDRKIHSLFYSVFSNFSDMNIADVQLYFEELKKYTYRLEKNQKKLREKYSISERHPFAGEKIY